VVFFYIIIMRKLIFILSLICAYSASAQEIKYCYTTQVYREVLKQRPELLQVQKELENFTEQYVAHHAADVTGTVLVIPIVFHIIHNNGPENISEAQVLDQVRILNEDFRLLNSDTSLIVQAFKPIAADCEIEFRLATLDPNGNCTTGIDRIQSALTYNGDDGSKLDPWPSNMYLNIWTVHDLGSSGAAAYAYYPGFAPPGADGVIAIHNYIGSIGTGDAGRSRVLTHEIGHCLNLAHVWGSTNDPGVACGNDGVSDTPETMGWVTCNLNGSICNSPLLENVQNYMEYSYCCLMFTQGQKTRMHAALMSSAGGRNNLWQTSNLIATGTYGSPAPLCAPIADFTVNDSIFCTGDSVKFYDFSWSGHPTSWNWNFPGGIPSSSTDSFPTVVYPSAGTYDATLTVGNTTGSDSKTATSLIFVASSTGQAVPFTEGFENSFPGTAGIINTDNGNTWEQVNNTSYSGTQCMRINNYSGNSTGAIDKYISPVYDFTGIVSPTLTFRVAYSQRTDTSRHDYLSVYYSLDCGKTWTWRYTRQGSGLATVPPHSGAYTPAGASDWRLDHVSVPIFADKPSVRVMFVAISGRGNNLYIDDINLNGNLASYTGYNEALSSLQLSPVPSQGQIDISFSLDKTSDVSLEVFDLPGKKIAVIANQKYNQGKHDLNFDGQLPDGIYFLKVMIGEALTIRKFVIAN
jgi:PKD repeat protein